MIDKRVLTRVRNGICSVGYLTVPAEEYARNPAGADFKVLGAGFLVRDDTVLTNRHVLLALHHAQSAENFPDEQKYLTFVYRNPPGWETGYCRMQETVAFENEELDIGFIKFVRRPEAEFEHCQPLELADPLEISVGQPVAVCGYPSGADMLVRNGKVYRFGPVLQQGHISAVAPYDGVGRVDEVLLDVRGAGGMSGSPVFLPESGKVVGILYAIWEATTAVAVPLDASSMNEWLELVEI